MYVNFLLLEEAVYRGVFRLAEAAVKRNVDGVTTNELKFNDVNVVLNLCI